MRRPTVALIAAVLLLAGCAPGAQEEVPSAASAAASATAPVRPAGATADSILGMTFPVGVCGNSSIGWENTVPITVANGEGEALTSSGEFAGASITGAKLVDWLDADADGTEDAVVAFTCFGSTKAMCCAGRTSMMEVVGVFDFSTPASPRLIGTTIMPGSSPPRDGSSSEPRMIDRVRVDGSTVVTDEKLIYADTSAASADLGFPPNATVEVTHRFVDGQWVATERIVG